MNICVNGQSQVPPGFRFHPTEEELLHYYLRKKVAYEKIDLDVIRDVDLNKLEPWDIQEACKIGSTPQNDWYFFSHKDKKYPTGTRTNRATAAGFWKATGRDKVIYSNLRLRIGMRKTLVFYRGRAPHGQKSDWIMHEYRLLDDAYIPTTNVQQLESNVMMGESGQEEGWVVCRVFKKKNYHPRAASNSSPMLLRSSSNATEEGTLEQLLQFIGMRSSSTGIPANSDCQEEEKKGNNSPGGVLVMSPIHTQQRHDDNVTDGTMDNSNRYMKLPSLLESPSYSTETAPRGGTQNGHYQQTMTDSNKVGAMIISNNQLISTFSHDFDGHHDNGNNGHEYHDDLNTGGGGVGGDWADLDRLVASHLNGPVDVPFHSPGHDHRRHNLRQAHRLQSSAFHQNYQDSNNNGHLMDLWSLPIDITSNETPP